MGGAIAATVLRLFGLGAILSAVSEVWYYPVDFHLGLLELCLYYGVIAYVCWLLAARVGAKTVAAGFVAACLFGYLIEGVPVGFLYSALPFTIVWTSMAWHALIAVGVGLWLFRRIMARGSLVGQLAFCAGCGMYLGIVTVELWTMPNDGDPWVWPDVVDHWNQQLAGWVIFISGHIALNISARHSVRPATWELPVFATLTALMFAIQNAIIWFPVSLVLPVLSFACVWVLWRARGPEPAPVLVRLTNWRVPITGIMVSLVIPVAATMTHQTLARYDLRLEGSVIHIMWAGPASAALLVYSIWRLMRQSQT